MGQFNGHDFDSPDAVNNYPRSEKPIGRVTFDQHKVVTLQSIQTQLCRAWGFTMLLNCRLDRIFAHRGLYWAPSNVAIVSVSYQVLDQAMPYQFSFGVHVIRSRWVYVTGGVKPIRCVGTARFWLFKRRLNLVADAQISGSFWRERSRLVYRLLVYLLFFFSRAMYHDVITCHKAKKGLLIGWFIPIYLFTASLVMFHKPINGFLNTFFHGGEDIIGSIFA